jgi:hypothetical protein
MAVHLIPEWRRVLAKAWSIRLVILAALLSGVELVLPLVQDWFPRYVFGVLSFGVTVGAVWARLVAQPKMRSPEEEAKQNE